MQGEKKLVIKPLKLKPRLPDDFETSNWDRLSDAVSAVQCTRPVSCSLEELYHSVEDLCVHNLAPKVYSQLQQLCDHHAETTISALASWASLDAVAFLDHVGRAWETYCKQTLLIRQIFLYLDRTYVFNFAAARSIFDMGLQLFRAHLGRHPEVERKLVDGLLTLVDAERNGEAVDHSLLKELLRMLSNLGMYAEAFEWPFLDRARRYFTAEGERLIQVFFSSFFFLSVFRLKNLNKPIGIGYCCVFVALRASLIRRVCSMRRLFGVLHQNSFNHRCRRRISGGACRPISRLWL